MSNKAKGHPQRNAELRDPSLWEGISVMNTPGHHTLRGTPEDFLACVVEVVSVEPVEES